MDNKFGRSLIQN